MGGRLLWHAPWLLVLAAWPCTGRYTSFGLDVERPCEPGEPSGDYVRLRWPGDGSVCLLWVRERLPAPGPEATSLDLGGAFLQPPTDVQPANGWQRAGFWCLCGDRHDGPTPAIVAGSERWCVVGVPHGLLFGMLAAGAFVVERRRKARESRLAPPPHAA